MRSADALEMFGGHLREDTMSKAFAITSLAAVKTLFVVADCFGGCN